MTRSTMSRRFSSMSGLASWFGKRAVDLEAQPRRPAGQPIEEPRRDEPGHAAAGVEHDVERLDGRRVDERHDLLDVVVEQRRASRAARRAATAPGIVPVVDHVADVADAGVAGERERLAPHHLDAVVLLRVVRRGDLRAAVEAVADDGEVEHVGARTGRSRRRRRPARARPR